MSLHCEKHGIRFFDVSKTAEAADFRCIKCEIERADKAADARRVCTCCGSSIFRIEQLPQGDR